MRRRLPSRAELWVATQFGVECVVIRFYDALGMAGITWRWRKK